LLVTVMLSGCGNTIYTYRAYGAADKIEEARKAGAEQSATYEYTLAQEHLRKAKSEAAEADYGDACELANAANDYAQRAIDKAKYRGSKGSQKPTATTEADGAANASLSISVGDQK
jgi:hypothetical protein